MVGQRWRLICILGIVHIKKEMEATFLRLAFSCTEHKRSAKLVMVGQSWTSLCKLSILQILAQMEATICCLSSLCTEHIK